MGIIISNRGTMYLYILKNINNNGYIIKYSEWLHEKTICCGFEVYVSFRISIIKICVQD